jgi:hypothetical protein
VTEVTDFAIYFSNLDYDAQSTIPDDHRDRLAVAGYVREVVRTTEGSALSVTGRGLRRLALGE